jgi:hypothetical protein
MDSFETITGSLMVSNSPDSDENIDPDVREYLYGNVLFVSDEITLRFYSAMGGYFPVKEEHFATVSEDTFYYPYYNETKVSIEISDDSKDNLRVLKEDVKLEYKTNDKDTYIRSGSEITAYGGFHYSSNGNIYKCHESLLLPPGDDTEEDSFLGIESVTEPVTVENIQTGYTVPIEYSVVENIIESDEVNNGILKVSSENSITNWLSQTLESRN